MGGGGGGGGGEGGREGGMGAQPCHRKALGGEEGGEGVGAQTPNTGLRHPSSNHCHS